MLPPYTARLHEVLLLLSVERSNGQSDFEYDVDQDKEQQNREFMIPHPRLGRYMDYAVLKLLANYLKDSYSLKDIFPADSKIEMPSDVILQRELRDMKGKGYGIPIPRVGKRSISNLSPSQSDSSTAVKNFLDSLKPSVENNGRSHPVARSMFTPRVGRAEGRVYTWAAIPRVG